MRNLSKYGGSKNKLGGSKLSLPIRKIINGESSRNVTKRDPSPQKKENKSAVRIKFK
tara:strand:+ start:653 stop:823 length:171 start_codon:yes stop_codon:yes gene_type:complete